MRKGLLGHLEDYLAGFFGHAPAQPEAERAPSSAPPEARPVAAELDESLTALQALAREMAQRMRAGQPSMSLVGERPDLEKLKKEAEVHHRAIAQDIVALHEKLGTGLTREQLEGVQAGLTPLLPYIEKEQGGMVDRMYYHVLSRVLRETAIIAWDDLMTRMEKAGLKWPVPGGLMPTATAEDREAARLRSVKEARENFLEAKPAHACDRVFGLVRIWRASYPARDSDLWFQQCLLGVASGRQLQLFETGAGLLMGPAGEEIKGKLREAAGAALSETRELLRQGGTSFQDVNQMLVSTDRLASQIAPDLVWAWLEPQLAAQPAAT